VTEPLSLSNATELAVEIETRWSERTLASDVDGLLRLFTEDAVFLGSFPTMYIGHDGIRQYLSRVTLGGARTITFQNRRVQVLAQNVFTTTSYVLFDVEVDGKSVRLRYGISWAVVEKGEEWKIAQHHASPREET